MTYLDRQFEERFRGAAHEEILQGEEQFMADMAEVITQESIDEGVYVDFGPNRQRFEQVLGLLNIDALLARNQLEVARASVTLDAGISRQIGLNRIRTLPAKHGALATLEAMQSEAWEIGSIEGRWKYLTTKTYRNVVTELNLGNIQPAEEENTFEPAPDSLMVTLRNYVQYAPQLIGEWGDIDSPVRYVDRMKKKDYHAPILAGFLERNRAEDERMTLPESSYGLLISAHPYVSGDLFASSLQARYEHQYMLVNDRIEKYVNPYTVDE